MKSLTQRFIQNLKKEPTLWKIVWLEAAVVTYIVAFRISLGLLAVILLCWLYWLLYMVREEEN